MDVTFEVGDHVHVVGSKQVGTVVEVEGEWATIRWGVLDGETFTSRHSFLDIYKSDYVPKAPQES